MTPIEARARRALRWAAGDDGARWAFRVMIVVTIPIYYFVGRHQWFTKDDWAYVLTRGSVLEHDGWQPWLFDAQDGHWLTIPVLIFHVTKKVFELESYWPFLIPTMGAHVAAVLLARAHCRRLRVSAWTTTLVCSMLLVFGNGFDNIVFAIQICYNLSLVLFLGQLLLVDHDGPVDRRDYAGAGLGVLSVMSSGFGPIFMVGTFVLLALRRRWRALAIAVVPQALVYGWWLVTWASDPVSDKLPGDRALLPAYLVRGVTATFESLVAVPALAGVAIIGALAITFWRGIAWDARSSMVALWATIIVMFLAIGFERIGFGVPTAAASRYLHMAAIVIAPVFAVAVDRLRAVAVEAQWAGRLLVVAAVAINAGALRVNAAAWAIASRDEKNVFDLISGSPDLLRADPHTVPVPTSPNVSLVWLPELLWRGAIDPRMPATDEERQLVLNALKLAP